MEQLIELLQQIQELAGVGIDALQQAGGGGAEPQAEGAPQAGGASPAETPMPPEGR